LLLLREFLNLSCSLRQPKSERQPLGFAHAMSEAPQPNRLTYPDFHPLSGQDLIVVHDHDVLSGRGVNIAQHPGNERFRALVQTRSDAAYCKNYTSLEKKAVAEEIIQHIKRLSPPGRFLKRTGRSKNARGLHGPWDELTDKEARKKTCQALRDCNRNDREGYAAAVSVPVDVIHSSVARQQTGLSNKEYAEQMASAANPLATAAAAPAPDDSKPRAVQAQQHQQQTLPLVPSLPQPPPAMQTITHATPMSMVSSSAMAAAVTASVTAAASAAATTNPTHPPQPSSSNQLKRSREEISTDSHNMLLQLQQQQQHVQFLSPPTHENAATANSWLKTQRTAPSPPNPSLPLPPPSNSTYLQQQFLGHPGAIDHHMALLHHFQHHGQQHPQSPPSAEVAAAAAEWLKQQQQQQQQLWVLQHPVVVNNMHTVAAMNQVAAASTAAASASAPVNPSPPPLSNSIQPIPTREVVHHDDMLLHFPEPEQRKPPPSVEAPAATAWPKPQHDLAERSQAAAVAHPSAMHPSAPSTAASSGCADHPGQDLVQENMDDYAAVSLTAYAVAEAAASVADEFTLSKSPLQHHLYQHANTSLPPSFPPSPATALAAANGELHGAFDPATMASIARAFQDEDNLTSSVVAAHAPRRDPYFGMGEDPLFGNLHFHPSTFSHNHLTQRRENNQAHNAHTSSGSGGSGNDDEESHSDSALFI
jgi:hypothetical protein